MAQRPQQVGGSRRRAPRRSAVWERSIGAPACGMRSRRLIPHLRRCGIMALDPALILGFSRHTCARWRNAHNRLGAHAAGLRAGLLWERSIGAPACGMQRRRLIPHLRRCGIMPLAPASILGGSRHTCARWRNAHKRSRAHAAGLRAGLLWERSICAPGWGMQSRRRIPHLRRCGIMPLAPALILGFSRHTCAGVRSSATSPLAIVIPHLRRCGIIPGISAPRAPPHP